MSQAQVSFRDLMVSIQLDWKRRRLPAVRQQGTHNGTKYPHILADADAEQNLWSYIAVGGTYALAPYLAKPPGIQPHIYSHYLNSSWTLGANLYFPYRQEDAGREVLASFFASVIDPRIVGVTNVELEWAPSSLSPSELLNEKGGGRGAYQTSPDVGFEVRLADGGRGLILTEVKFTERDFSNCSALSRLTAQRRAETCESMSALSKNPEECGQYTELQRLYWPRLAKAFDWSAGLTRCPAARHGYQLFRQQALAEALAATGQYDLVVSSLAYDKRNGGLLESRKGLLRCLDTPTAGTVADVRSDWGPLFKHGRAPFKAFSHQAFVAHVRASSNRPDWCDDWLEYITDRYWLER